MPQHKQRAPGQENHFKTHGVRGAKARQHEINWPPRPARMHCTLAPACPILIPLLVLCDGPRCVCTADFAGLQLIKSPPTWAEVTFMAAEVCQELAEVFWLGQN